MSMLPLHLYTQRIRERAEAARALLDRRQRAGLPGMVTGAEVSAYLADAKRRDINKHWARAARAHTTPLDDLLPQSENL